LVIGIESMLGDPIFINTSVFKATHGMGKWDPDLLAPSFRTFLKALDVIRKVAVGREHPVALKKRPIPLFLRLMTLYRIRKAAPGTSLFFWWGWMKA